MRKQHAIVLPQDLHATMTEQQKKGVSQTMSRDE